MGEEKALIPLQTKTVDFYGDEITILLIEINKQRQIYVHLRPLCEKYLGLAWSSQLQRIKEDEVLAEGLISVLLSNTELRRQRYTVTCLHLDLLAGWLFGISPSRVRPDLQEKMKRYRREGYRVLHQAFVADMLFIDTQETITNDILFIPTEEMSVSTNISLIQIRNLGLAMARMAEQQMEFEQKLATTNQRLDVAATIVGRMDRRLGELEKRISPPSYVTEDMANEIKLTVQALGNMLSQHDPTQNHYKSIYTEIYRRTGAGSYERIRIDKYDEVIQFLEDWKKAFETGNTQS